MVDISGLRNPYDYANPVRAGERFAGRGAELGRIAYVLDQAGADRPVGYLALHGRRAAGKTSLLNMTEKLAVERGHLAVRVNLVPADATPARFFATLYEELIGAVAGACDLEGPDGRDITPRVVRRIVEGGPVAEDFPLEFPENLAHAVRGGDLSEMALRTDLARLGTLVGRPIVLLVDEVQLIADQPDVLSLLRTLGMRSLTGYVLVLAGTTELVERINEVFDFLLRQFEFVEVERFAELAEVVECVTRPLRTLGLVPERCFRRSIGNMASDLMRLTDGNPYEIQLFCHVMFTRWQTGIADWMDLTPKSIDDVQSTLDIAGRHPDRPLVNAVRKMSDGELLALNAWCSSLEDATVDEIRFACQVSGLITLDVDALNRYLSKFVDDGLVELVDNKIQLIGNAAEHIYARLSMVQRSSTRSHILIRRVRFATLLADELHDLLFHGELGHPLGELRTCCATMAPKKLDQGVLDLYELPDNRNISYTVEYLHEAVLESGVPEALKLTTITCSYGKTTATRWAFHAASDDFDLSAHPAFSAAQRRISRLGGALHASCVTIQLRSMTEIVDWLVEHFPDPRARSRMARNHNSAAMGTYGVGDVEGTFAHLDAAYRLDREWQSANNMGYLKLAAGDHREASVWALRAVELAENTGQRALSCYNAGVAAAMTGEWGTARRLFTDASSAMEQGSPLVEDDLEASYLMVLSHDGRVLAQEKRDVALADAITKACNVVEFASLSDRLRDSP